MSLNHCFPFCAFVIVGYVGFFFGGGKGLCSDMLFAD